MGYNHRNDEIRVNIERMRRDPLCAGGPSSSPGLTGRQIDALVRA